MNYSTLGRLCGLRVSEFGLGTGNFGAAWGHGTDSVEARRIFERFTETGGTLIDTADNYQGGDSETMLADFISSERDHLVLASKFSRGAGPGPSLSISGNSRKSMAYAIEDSLRRLKTDRIDLYWVHYDDQVTPTEEIVRGLDDLVRSGKILYGGLSNFSAWRSARAQTIAELRGLAPIVGIQVEYSLVDRTADRDLIPMAEATGMGVCFYSPLGGGLLTGKSRANSAGAGDEGPARPFVVWTESTDQIRAVVDETLAVASEIQTPPEQVAIAWLRARDAVSSTALVTLIGPRTLRAIGLLFGGPGS